MRVLPFPSHPISFQPVPSYPIPSCPISFHPILSHPTPSHYPILSNPIPSCPIPFHPIPSYPILSCISSHPILSHFVPSHPVLPCPISFHPIPSQPGPAHPIPFCLVSHLIPSFPIPPHGAQRSGGTGLTLLCHHVSHSRAHAWAQGYEDRFPLINFYKANKSPPAAPGAAWIWTSSPHPAGPQCAGDHHQRREVLALLAVPGQAPQTPPCLRAPDHEGPPHPILLQ